MMTKQELQTKIQEAVKSGDSVTASYYKMIFSEAQRIENDLKNPLPISEKTIATCIKKLYESAKLTYQYSSKPEIHAELTFYSSLLPKTLNETDTKTVINDILDNNPMITPLKKNKGFFLGKLKERGDIDLGLAAKLLDPILITE